MSMNVIDFNEKKRKKEATVVKEQQMKLLWQFQQSGKLEFLHKLVVSKELDFEAHQLLLAFIMAMESHNMKIFNVYSDALCMTRTQFHRKYTFDWWTSVQCALAFLAIQKETNQGAYEKHIALMARI